MGAMKKFVLILIVGLAAAGAYNQYIAPNDTALATYMSYRDTVIAGRSFDEDAAFYSTARRAEIQARIDSTDDGEALKGAYLEFTQNQAACSELSLVEETQTDGVARLVFDVTDTCDTYGEAKVQEIVELVEEDGGWKIVLNETSIAN